MFLLFLNLKRQAVTPAFGFYYFFLLILAPARLAMPVTKRSMVAGSGTDAAPLKVKLSTTKAPSVLATLKITLSKPVADDRLIVVHWFEECEEREEEQYVYDFMRFSLNDLW